MYPRARPSLCHTICSVQSSVPVSYIKPKPQLPHSLTNFCCSVFYSLNISCVFSFLFPSKPTCFHYFSLRPNLYSVKRQLNTYQINCKNMFSWVVGTSGLSLHKIDMFRGWFFNKPGDAGHRNTWHLVDFRGDFLGEVFSVI